MQPRVAVFITIQDNYVLQVDLRVNWNGFEQDPIKFPIGRSVCWSARAGKNSGFGCKSPRHDKHPGLLNKIAPAFRNFGEIGLLIEPLSKGFSIAFQSDIRCQWGLLDTRIPTIAAKSLFSELEHWYDAHNERDSAQAVRELCTALEL